MLELLRQAALWTLATCLTVILVSWILNALDERQRDRDAISPELLRDIKAKNVTIARRRATETIKTEPNNAA